jgi:predicted RNase H-like HicB family nuclease
MVFRIVVGREDSGRWTAEVVELPGQLVYGPTRLDAVAKAKSLALTAVALQLERGVSASRPGSESWTNPAGPSSSLRFVFRAR